MRPLSRSIDYLLIGHITADILARGRLLGGTVSYAAPVARAFGYRVGVLTSAAACEPLLSTLLPFAEISIQVAEETTTFENIYQDSIRIQYLHERAESLTYDHIPVGWVNAPLVHLAPLVEEVPTDIVDKFPDATVMLTPQGWLRRWDDDGRVHFKRWFDAGVLEALDVVIFSRHDIAEAPELEAEFAKHVKNLFVTDGRNGGTYYHQGKPTPYLPVRVTETEPTGAGDVFSTSILASLPKVDHDMNIAVAVAARLAALSVTRTGIDALRPDEIEQALDDARQDET